MIQYMKPETTVRKHPIRNALGAILAIIVVVFLVLTLMGIPLSGIFPSKSKYTSTNDPYMHLMQGNGSFADAENQRRLGNATSAIALYQSAIGTAPDKEQKDQIRYKIGLAEYDRGNVGGAIDLYMNIARDGQATPIVRAYAIQTIGRFWQEFGNVFEDQIFSQPPFATFYHPKDLSLTQRELFAYASDFYPLAFSELYVADWYATKLERSFTGKDQKLSDAEQKEYLTELRRRIDAAEHNLARSKDDPNTANLVPPTLLLRASIERSLAVIGESTPEKTEHIFSQVLASYAVVKGTPDDGLARFQYARFLNQVYGEKRAADIRKILSPMYASNAYEHSSAFRYFAREKDDARGKKRYLVALAAKDPNFKKLLIRLGWQTRDFTGSNR